MLVDRPGKAIAPLIFRGAISFPHGVIACR